MEHVEFYTGFEPEETIIERCYISKATPLNPHKARMDIEYNDPAFVVGVYKRDDCYYLQLSHSLYSYFVDTCIENDSLPNCDKIEISKSEVLYHINKLSKFGTDIYGTKLNNFDKFLTALVSIIPCTVYFEPLFNKGGCFLADENRIVVANNTSHFLILFTLLHEYAHYLTHNMFSTKKTPENMEEYIFDTWENTCNIIAYEVMHHYFTEYIGNICNTIKKTITDITPNDTSHTPSDEQLSIILSLQARRTFNNLDLQKTQKIVKEIIKKTDEKLKSTPNKYVEFYQSGLAVLSDDDNQKLYDYIINEVSPLIPPDDFED